MRMEFYVLNYDFNRKEVINFNIFQSVRFSEGVDKLLDNFITYEDFRAKLDSLLRYCFWSKREYEISVGDAFEEDLARYEKIDVYRQVAPNIDLLAHYIIENHNQNIDQRLV